MDLRRLGKAARLAAAEVVKRGPTSGFINRVATNLLCDVTTPRPRAFSLWSNVPKPNNPANPEEEGPVGEYTTWPMLTDRKYSARHLPPAPQAYVDALRERAPDARYDASDPANPVVGDVTGLFARPGVMRESRSSMLFMFFAQWFTDSILRIDPMDRRRNTSNHNIDLCQIYGRSEPSAKALRSKTEKGKLAYQVIDGAVYPDYLGEVRADGTWAVKSAYQELPYADPIVLARVFEGWIDDEDRRDKFYATGLERGNSSIGYVAVSTIFLREHNNICDALVAAYPGWDDERVFQTARMINTVILMKLVVVDYINHIGATDRFAFDPSFAEEEDWYRTPWIALEFDLLYRWHGMVPDSLSVGGDTYDDQQYRFNNGLLEQAGVDQIIDAASRQRAGKIGLGNVPDFLLGAEYHSIRMGRDFRLQSYNAYREKFGRARLRTFDDLTDDPALRAKLETLYGDIDQVEFVVGLFGQKSDGDRLYGDLLYDMVAYDAFTQIYTNPLLSRNVYNARTFTQLGLDRIDATNSVQDLVDRNSSGNVRASFDA